MFLISTFHVSDFYLITGGPLYCRIKYYITNQNLSLKLELVEWLVSLKGNWTLTAFLVAGSGGGNQLSLSLVLFLGLATFHKEKFFHFFPGGYKPGIQHS